MPALLGAMVGKGIVPCSQPVYILSCGQGCACRDTDGRWRIGGRKVRAGLGQGIKMGGLYMGMSHAAHGIAIVLIRNDEQKIGRCHLYPFPIMTRNRAMQPL